MMAKPINALTKENVLLQKILRTALQNWQEKRGHVESEKHDLGFIYDVPLGGNKELWQVGPLRLLKIPRPDVNLIFFL